MQSMPELERGYLPEAEARNTLVGGKVFHLISSVRHLDLLLMTTGRINQEDS